MPPPVKNRNADLKCLLVHSRAKLAALSHSEELENELGKCQFFALTANSTNHCEFSSAWVKLSDHLGKLVESSEQCVDDTGH